MKRTAAAILALVITVCGMSACGNAADPDVQSGKVNIDISQGDTVTSTTVSQEQTDASDETTADAVQTTANETTEPEETASETTAPEPDITETVTTSDVVTTTTVKQTTTTTTTTKKPAETKAPAGFSDADAAIVYGGATIAVNSDFASAKSKLGNPDSKQENPNCITGSSGFTYIYGSMTVNVYMKGNAEYVEGIMVDGGNKNIKTPKGITIGSSVSDLTAAYGKAATSEDFLTEYRGNSATVLFYTENGKVTGIFMTVNY